MKRVWAISGGLIPVKKDWPEVFTEIRTYNPEEIYILSNTEVDIEGNWGLLLDFLQKWKKKNPPTKISVITPHLQNVEIRKRIFTEQSYAMVESVVPLFINKKVMPKQLGPLEFRNIEKTFSCYMFRPDESRGRLIDTLIDNNLLEFGHVTYHNTHIKTHRGFKYYNKEALTLESENYSKDSLVHFMNPALYCESFIDLVPEASFLPGQYFLTEKTIRAIMHKKPFVSLASPGFHTKYLTNFFKLELYDEFIDYSFDKEDNLQKRIDGIVKNIVELSKLSKKEIRSLIIKIKPKLRHNTNRLEYIYKTPNLLVPQTMKHLIASDTDYELRGRHQVTFFEYIKKVRMNNGKLPR